MPQIENPRRSRALDVHRWSDHPEVKGMVDDLWEGGLKEHFESRKRDGKARPGPRPKADHKDMLRVLILDLYVAWMEDPELCVGISKNVNSWKAGSRYNALHLSKNTIKVMEALEADGYIDVAPGSYAEPGAPTNRTTRIRAAPELQEKFQNAKFCRDEITRVRDAELIAMRGDKGNGRIGPLLEYKDTPVTMQYRESLLAYNDLIGSTFIDIPTLNDPVIPADADRLIQIGLDYCRTRRVFSRNNWQMNGRFYGGWWQRVDDEWRSKIFINNSPTVEVDFKGLHVALLYAKAGLAMTHDPYDLQDELLGLSGKALRKVVKALVLTAINAKDKKSAYGAFRDGFPAGHSAKRMTNTDLDHLLEAFLRRNPPLCEYLFSDQGIGLMFEDSQITSWILDAFTRKGIPVLSIHDSYIIDHWHVDQLRAMMELASRAVTGGFALETEIKLPDREEYSRVSSEELQQYVEETRRIKPSAGYISRMEAFDQRTGRGISPPLWSQEELLAMHKGEW